MTPKLEPTIQWKLQELEKADTPEWDTFVGGQEEGHFKQTSTWNRFKKTGGWKPKLLTGRLEGRLIGGVVILVRRHWLGLMIGYVSRGPVAVTSIPGLAELVLKQLDHAARLLKLAYLVVVPPYRGFPMSTAIEELGFMIKPERLPPTRIMPATILVDLRATENELLANMRKVTRYDVRQGLKSPLQFHEGGRDDLEHFHRLMVELCVRRGAEPRPRVPNYFFDIWDAMHGAGHVKLFLCKHESQVVSGAFALTMGRTLRVWRVGWSGEFSDMRPNHLLWWRTMLWAKERGFEALDFVHIPRGHAESILRGERPSGQYAGVTEFKRGFGGEVIALPPAVYRSYWKSVQHCLRKGGDGLLQKLFREIDLEDTKGTAVE